MADIAQAQTTRRDALREAEPEAVRSWNPSDGWMAFLFTFPTMALLVFIGVFPLIWSLGLSFTRYDFTRSAAPAFVGFLNYARVLDNEDIWSVFITTAKYVLMAVGVEFFLGFGIALLLNRAAIFVPALDGLDRTHNCAHSRCVRRSIVARRLWALF